MIKLITIAALSLLSYFIKAQSLAPIDKQYIEVSGTSETEVTPDEIYITIVLQERAEKGEKLLIQKQEDNLKTNLKELGIDLSNLSLTEANADFRKIKSLKKDVVTTKTYILKINKPELIGPLYERFDKINISDAYISKFSHSKIIDLTKENRIKAIKAAKEKVEYLLSAVGKTAGNPIQITETNNYVQSTPYNYYGGYAYGRLSNTVSQANSSYAEESENSESVSINKIKIRSTFLVRYEIK